MWAAQQGGTAVHQRISQDAVEHNEGALDFWRVALSDGKVCEREQAEMTRRLDLALESSLYVDLSIQDAQTTLVNGINSEIRRRRRAEYAGVPRRRWPIGQTEVATADVNA